MIFILMLTSVFGAVQQPMVCEQILDPTYCKGPAAGMPGFVCKWEENECEKVNINMPIKPKDACKALSNNQVACQDKQGCRYDLSEFECKVAFEYENGMSTHPSTNPQTIPSTSTGMNSATPQNNAYGTPTNAGVAPVANGNQFAGANTHPGTPSRPGTPSHPGTPSYPGTPSTIPNGAHNTGMNSAPTPQTPNAGTAPGVTNNGQSHGLTTASPLVSPTSPATGQGTITSSTTPSQPRFCKSLTQLDCFGPSTEPGKLCFWDAEDWQCSEATKYDVEAICKQFARDMQACDQHENCFWDAKDNECSEIEFGPGAMFHSKPILRVQCGATQFQNLNACAAEASCFWDPAGVCINVIQAQNVCGVLKSAQACSTNTLCHFRQNTCQLAKDPTKGLLRSVHINSEPQTSGQGQYDNLLIMVACGFSGVVLGLLFSWASQKCYQPRMSNEDYRDIILDVNSHRRHQVV